MRSFTPELYKKLLENSKDAILQQQMMEELKYITDIQCINEKTVVDLGAGYGRLTNSLSHIAKNVISVEINPIMFKSLEETCNRLENCKAVSGNFLNLSKLLLKYDISNPVFLVLQNTVGTIEDGSFFEFLEELKYCFIKYKAEIFITFFRQEQLVGWGLEFYKSLHTMIGHVDYAKTDFDNGLFYSDNGYSSKWRSEPEIRNIISFFNTNQYKIISFKHYTFIHLYH